MQLQERDQAWAFPLGDTRLNNLGHDHVVLKIGHPPTKMGSNIQSNLVSVQPNRSISSNIAWNGPEAFTTLTST